MDEGLSVEEVVRMLQQLPKGQQIPEHVSPAGLLALPIHTLSLQSMIAYNCSHYITEVERPNCLALHERASYSSFCCADISAEFCRG